MPEVFAQPPEIIAGFMWHEVEQALLAWNPLISEIASYSKSDSERRCSRVSRMWSVEGDWRID